MSANDTPSVEPASIANAADALSGSPSAPPVPEALDLLGQLFRRARETPTRPWLYQTVAGDRQSWTWGEAADEIARMASALRALGFPAGSRICISGRNTAHWVMADLAILLAGHVPVGLYPRQSADNTRYVIEHAQARAVFLGPAQDAAVTASAVPEDVVTIGLPYPDVPLTRMQWSGMIAAQSPLRREQAPPADTLALLLYTSGTSGRPKGVMLTYANIAFTARHALAHVFRPEGPQRLLSYLPLAHAQERLTCESLSLLVGAEIHFLEKIEALGTTLAEVQPTFFTAGPPVYARMQAAILQRMPQSRLSMLLALPVIGGLLRRKLRTRLGLRDARLCIVGGAAMPAATFEWFATLGIDVRQGYGSTENCGYVSCNLPGAALIGSVGRPLPGAEVRIADDGEIQCRHAGTMVGYFRDPVRSREAMTDDGYFRTGDAGRFDADGFLHVDGRLGDRIVLADGTVFAPNAIEAAFAHPWIEHACVVGQGLARPVIVIAPTMAGRQAAPDAFDAIVARGFAAIDPGVPEAHRPACALLASEAWLPDNGFVTPTMKLRRATVEAEYGERAIDALASGVRGLLRTASTGTQA